LLNSARMKKQTKLDLSNNTLSLRKEVIRELLPQDREKVIGGGGGPDIRVVTSLPGKHC
jgi:hypothetical protein